MNIEFRKFSRFQRIPSGRGITICICTPRGMCFGERKRGYLLIISSWDYQIMKPDIRLFQIAVEKSGYNASETVMVGDRLDNDIFPAKNIGMKTIWIKQGFGGMQNPKTDEYLPHTEIASLSELLDIL
jgi:phosphoglycolate phosphatase-like HAD superfamily hydrolase